MSSLFPRLLVAISLLACTSTDVGGTPDSAVDAGSLIDANPNSNCTVDNSKTYFADRDQDGFGDPEVIAVDCGLPEGFVENNEDCNDDDPLSKPGGIEVCDGRDNDCDEATVEECPSECSAQDRGSDVYLFCAQGQNFENAEAHCQAQGMHLVRIDDQAENEWVGTQRLVAFGSTFEVWIGASDAEESDSWRWRDGAMFWQGRAAGLPVDGLYSSWAAGEPNNNAGNGVAENCAVMRNDQQWNDRPCGLAYRFVCEREEL
jgi:hypothetical protein